MNPSDKK